MGGSGWSIGPGISFCLNFLFDIPLWNMDDKTFEYEL